VGVDIARSGDLTVIELCEHLAGVECVRLVIEMHDAPFAVQEEWLYAVLAHPAMRRACFDQTGIGRQMTERAQVKFGTHRIEGVTFSTRTKEEMAYPVRAKFEDRTVRVPDDKHYTAP
jgi:phage FluMu gp28-like protein